MARVTKKKEEKKEVLAEAKVEKILTRAEKKTATQQLIKEMLQENSRKHNDLIDEVSKNYAQKFGGEETENINDVKGRVGSVLDIMKKDGEVLYEGGMYALKEELQPAKAEKQAEKPVKKATRAKGKKAEKAETLTEEVKPEMPTIPTEEKQEQPEKAVKKTAKKATKTTKKALKAKENETMPQTETEEVLPLPPGPIQPIAPVAPITPEVAPEPIPEKKEPAKKTTRSKAKKATETASEKESSSLREKTENELPMVALNAEIEEKKTEEITAEKAVESKNSIVVKEKGEIAPKSVMDMSFLFGEIKPKAEKAAEEKSVEKAALEEKKEEIKAEKSTLDKTPMVQVSAKEKLVKEEKTEPKTETKKENKQDLRENKQDSKYPTRRPATRENVKDIRKAERPQTADERLRDAYLKRMRSLGGDYFEYYSVYLLERYSMKNGRRLEGMRISGGDHDGGIDGEIELTDKFGFKETIYIQSKNWDPEKGKEEYWVVGETLLQQFIGACACRQAKDRKQHCRGIFITTSRFTPEAKRILDDMSDKIVGYDGADLYEAAKECQFGVIYENGNWKLDEKLLSGTKAFFNML